MGYHYVARRNLSSQYNIVRRNVLRKMNGNVDRLESQGVDPASHFKNGWRYVSCALIERYPVLTPTLSDIENKFLEKKFVSHQDICKGMTKEYFLSERDELQGLVEPIFTDVYADMYKGGDRNGSDEINNDRKSLKRRLDERLYFVVKKNWKSSLWTLPQMLVDEKNLNVHMRSWAERGWKGVIGKEKCDVGFLSWSPSCHLEHVYGVKQQAKHDVYGVKMFFYRGVVLNGDVKSVRNAVDWMWVAQDELEEAIGSEVYEGISGALLGNGV